MYYQRINYESDYQADSELKNLGSKEKHNRDGLFRRPVQVQSDAAGDDDD